jgi:hypothetical protein
MAEQRRDKIQSLAEPPPQTIRGVILYHRNGTVDAKIRRVRELREDWGFPVETIQQAVSISRGQLYHYLRQIEKARLAYMRAFPDEFSAGVEGLHSAIYKRETLETSLRKELAALKEDVNPSNRVGLYKLLMRNMRELEELRGLLIEHVEHGGEIEVKDHVLGLLESVPEDVRNRYLDAVEQVVATGRPAGRPIRPDD